MAAGYIFAILFPIIGFVLGIVVATRPHPDTEKHGAWIIIVSMLFFVLALVLLS